MTYEEFQAGVAETPEILDTIFEKHETDATNYLTTKKGKIVTTQKEYETNTQKAIDTATKQNHTAWEAKIEQVTGLKRPDGKKGLEWFDEISDKIKYQSEGNSTDSAVILGLKKELQEVRDSLTKKDKEALQARIDGEITSAIKGLAFAIPSHLKKDDEKSAYQGRKAEDATDIFNSRYKTSIDAQGRTVYTNKKGEAQLVNGEPMTADAIATRDFSVDLVPKGHKAKGAGSDKDDETQNENSEKEGFLGDTPEEIRLKLSEMGLAVGTEKWDETRTKAYLAAGYVKTSNGFEKKS